MNTDFIRLILLISAVLSFAYGAANFFKKKVALFKFLIASAMGCFMLGRLYEFVTIKTAEVLSRDFNIGMLATMGGFLFIFSASFGQIDSLVDDGSPELKKYRRIALIAPGFMAIASIPVEISQENIFVKLITFIMLAIIAAAAYYNLKLLIIPDVASGVVQSIRLYNLAALVLSVATAIQINTERLGLPILWTISSIIIAITYPLVLIFMGRGSKKWTA